MLVLLPAALSLSLAVVGLAGESAEAQRAESARGGSSAADREASRRAWRGLGRDGAWQALERHFPARAARRAWTPLAGISQERVRYLSDRVARIDFGPGERKQLAQSFGVPLRDRDRAGRRAPVSPELREAPGGFESVNPVVDVRYPSRLEEGIEFVEAGVTVAPPAGAGAGEPRRAGDKLFWANARSDSDVLVEPSLRGAEISVQIRSADAPSVYRLAFGLPQGAELRLERDARSGVASVAVVAGDRRLLHVSPAVAVDAEGRNVPVDYELEADALVMRVEHAVGDYMYPILLDPVIENQDSWHTNGQLDKNGWRFLNLIASGPSGDTWGSFGAGLYIRVPPGTDLHTIEAAWRFDRYGETSFVSRADFYWNLLWYQNGSSGTYIREGLWSASAGKWNSWVDIGQTYPNVAHRSVTPNFATTDPDWRTVTSADFRTIIPRDPSTWNEAYLGGAVVYLEDHDRPTIGSRSHTQDLNRWYDGGVTIKTSATGEDTGLGVKWFDVYGPNGIHDIATHGCTGTRLDRCPSVLSTSGNRVGPADFHTVNTSNIAEGRQLWAIRSMDILGQQSEPLHWYTQVDRTPPEVALSGSLYDRRDQEVPNGVYQVHADATDGDASSNADARSGVVHVELLLDGDLQAERDVPCLTDSCALDLDWVVNTATLAGGEHRVEVRARDALGHIGSDDFVFTKGCCLEGETASNWTSGRPRFGDVTGDERDDAVGRDVLGRLQVAVSNGAGFEPAVAWGQGPLVGNFDVADVNNDGFEDVLWHDAVTGALKVAASDGSAFASPATLGSAPREQRVTFADVDADGQADAVAYDAVSGVVSVAYSEGTGFEPAFAWTTWDTAYAFEVADVTGDGAADAVGRNSAGDVKVGVSDAGGFMAATSWGTWASDELRFADVDGDGLGDAVGYDRAAGTVDYGSSTGESFEAPKRLGSWSGPRLDSAEVTGDGLFDLVGHDPLSARLTVTASNAPTPVGPPADVDPADADVDVEDDVLAPVTPTGGASAAQTLPSRPVLGSEDEGWLTPVLSNPNATGRTDEIYRRLSEMGVTLVRFNAMWGFIQHRRLASGGFAGGRRYTWTDLDEAVARAKAHGMAVHITFTGTGAKSGVTECDDDYPNYSDGRGCDGGANAPTGIAPEPGVERLLWLTDFEHFVQEGVRRYTRNGSGDPAVRVQSFGIWNEPNLDKWLSDPSGATVMPTEVYRALYQAGYRGWRAAIESVTTDAATAVTGTQILIGELSSTFRSARGKHPDCPHEVALPGRPKCFWTSMDFLQQVVTGSPAGDIRASGVAYHPYQSSRKPNTPGALYDEAGNRRPGSPFEYGIGRLGVVNRMLEALCRPIATATKRCAEDPAKAQLKAPPSPGNRSEAEANAKRPGLYLTEFGYQNQPMRENWDNRHAKRNRYWHTEQVRANWFTQADGALDLAAKNKAKWMLIYHAIENPPDVLPVPDPRAKSKNDYGLFTIRDSAIEQSLNPDDPGAPPYTPGDEVTGRRPYGKDNERQPDTYGAPQQRLLYCAIRRWAIGHGYFDPAVPVPGRNYNRMNACPGVGYADESDRIR